VLVAVAKLVREASQLLPLDYSQRCANRDTVMSMNIKTFHPHLANNFELLMRIFASPRLSFDPFPVRAVGYHPVS
jgi:hypothetical protein